MICRRLIFLALVTIGAAACASADSSADDDVEATDEELTSCKTPRRYFVVLTHDRICEEVAGLDGRWLPSPTFVDAPPAVSARVCTMRWTGKRGSVPDFRALAEFVYQGQFSQSTMTAACGAALFPDVGELVEIPSLSNFGMAGAHGCDVCGTVQRGRLWVVLPPERIVVGEVALKLDNGTSAAFRIDGNARALSIALPPATGNYVEGPVKIY